jgi:hypothetical protein
MPPNIGLSAYLPPEKDAKAKPKTSIGFNTHGFSFRLQSLETAMSRTQFTKSLTDWR